MAQIIHVTPFASVYDLFFSKITDDMYMELTEEDTYSMLQPLLLSAIPQFEFPRVNLNDYVLEADSQYIINCGDADDNYENFDPVKHDNRTGYFNVVLTKEEQNILAVYMVVEWLGQQLATIDLVRLQYNGSDFKFTSQANHIQKLLALQKDFERKGFHLQRLYKRRKIDKNGAIKSTFGEIMAASFKD